MENKSQCKFIRLDLAEFYPSISKEILDNLIFLAQKYNDIPEKDIYNNLYRRIIKHCRQSLLCSNIELGRKKYRRQL